MKLNRICLSCLAIVLCAIPLVGCGSKDGGTVDAPLINNAPEPPPRPEKPEVTPSGGGGGTTAPAAGPASAPK